MRRGHATGEGRSWTEAEVASAFASVWRGSAAHLRPFLSWPHLSPSPGPELDAVAAADLACVWTIVDGEDESLWLLSGCHRANRLGYFITARP